MSCQSGVALRMAIDPTIVKNRKDNYILHKKKKLEAVLGSGKIEKNELFININSISPLIYQIVGSQANTGLRIYFASSIKTGDYYADKYFDTIDANKMALIFATTYDDGTCYTKDTGDYYTINQKGEIVALIKDTAQKWVSHYESYKKITVPTQVGNLPLGDTKSLWYPKMDFFELIEEIHCKNRNQSAKIIGICACLASYDINEPEMQYVLNGQQYSFNAKEQLTLIFSFTHKLYSSDNKTYTANSEIEITEAIKEVRKNQFAFLLAPPPPDEDFDTAAPCPPAICDGGDL